MFDLDLDFSHRIHADGDLAERRAETTGHWDAYLSPLIQQFVDDHCGRTEPPAADDRNWQHWGDTKNLAAFHATAIGARAATFFSAQEFRAFRAWFLSTPRGIGRFSRRTRRNAPAREAWAHDRVTALPWLTANALVDDSGRSLATAFRLAADLLKKLPLVCPDISAFGQLMADDDDPYEDNDGGTPYPTRWAFLMLYSLGLNHLLREQHRPFTRLLQIPDVRAAWRDVEANWPKNSGICTTASLVGFQLSAGLFTRHNPTNLTTLHHLDTLLDIVPDAVESEADEDDITYRLSEAVDQTLELVG